MCGIIAYCGHRPATPVILEGLKRLEYRGYDSAGLAVPQGGMLRVVRKPGKLAELEKAVPEAGNIMNATHGMGHTRWATHGSPSERNAHPHMDCKGSLALVHNGIIENYQEIKTELAAKGYTFSSDTDSEVLANLIAEGLTHK
jgi:glucosamine--fructose-6-phosphate aminotransferase (isomerizing)